MPASEPTGKKPTGATEIITRESGASVRRMRKFAVTVVTSPDPTAQGKTFSFAQDEVRIGSGADLDVAINDPAISREHLSIRLTPLGFQLSDLGSTNGSFIGDIKIDRVVVTAETTLAVGKSLLRLSPLAETVEQELSPRFSFGRMLGASAVMRETFALLEKVAASDLSVLIEGETGTGKELAAEGLHTESGRSGAFIAVNCGAIPRELIESELFGHEKGAFTGAVRERAGAFLAAHDGTIFLDEVGELPLDMQAKLLRVLERREVKPVGSDKTLSVNVRIVAATHRSLVKEVQKGAFRQDLYFRLAVVTVKIPPLRTRLDDLRLLTDAVSDELARRRKAQGLPAVDRLDDSAFGMLQRYDFPGNVRELRNIVERWAILGTGIGPSETTTIRADEPNDRLASEGPEGKLDPLFDLPYHEAKDAWTERFDRTFTEEALRKSKGNVSKAAREAGVDRRHIQRLMARFGIRDKPE